MLNGLCIPFLGEGCYFSCSSGDKKLENQGVAEWLLGRVLVYAQDLNKDPEQIQTKT